MKVIILAIIASSNYSQYKQISDNYLDALSAVAVAVEYAGLYFNRRVTHIPLNGTTSWWWLATGNAWGRDPVGGAIHDPGAKYSRNLQHYNSPLDWAKKAVGEAWSGQSAESGQTKAPLQLNPDRILQIVLVKN